MGAIAFTLLGKTQNRLVYFFTGDAAGTLTYATWLADAIAGSDLAVAATALGGTCDSDAKAGLAIAGLAADGTSPSKGGICAQITSYTLVTTAKAPVTVQGKDSGAGNNPDILLTPDASTNGILTIIHAHTIVN